MSQQVSEPDMHNLNNSNIDLISLVPEPTRLVRELSLTYIFPGDLETIEVPLGIRLKYDKVVTEIKDTIIES